nr:hypothetical protein Q903MT_gene2322 [Picea sitchensis]
MSLPFRFPFSTTQIVSGMPIVFYGMLVRVEQTPRLPYKAPPTPPSTH